MVSSIRHQQHQVTHSSRYTLCLQSSGSLDVAVTAVGYGEEQATPILWVGIIKPSHDGALYLVFLLSHISLSNTRAAHSCALAFSLRHCCIAYCCSFSLCTFGSRCPCHMAEILGTPCIVLCLLPCHHLAFLKSPHR